jgi:hypothetical protein
MGQITKNKAVESRDPDFINAEIALRRAAERAREVAARTHTPLIVYRNGRIIAEDVVESRVLSRD